MNKDALHLDNIESFTEWGGKSWSRLLSQSITNDIGLDFIKGSRVLEVGTRYGKMATFFAAELGANEVLGIDLSSNDFVDAKSFVANHGVSDKVTFEHCDGTLNAQKDGHFDFIFTKSVLVMVQDLDSYLHVLNNKLAPNGKYLFLENGKGNPLIQLSRSIRHRSWNSSTANFFTEDIVAKIPDSLDVTNVRKIIFPPIYSIAGSKKQGQNKYN